MGDPDRLNYLAGRKLSDISRMAQEAVKAAHIAGGVPNLEVRVPKRDEAGFAWLVCFFELACAISGYMSGVNPFDQPGVEAYKKNMFSCSANRRQTEKSYRCSRRENVLI